MSEAMDDAVDVVEVLPNEASDAGILGDGFKLALGGLITRSRSLDGGVIDERFGDMGNLWLQDEGDITMEDGDGVGGTLGEDCTSVGT